MVVSSFLLCDQLSGFNLHCACASAGFYLFFHTIKLVVKICTLLPFTTNDVYFFTARCYVNRSFAVERRLSVRLSVTLLYSLYCGRMC